MLAQAESDSAGIQYEDAPKTITVPGTTSKKSHKSEPGNGSQEAEANGSKTPGGSGGSGGSNGGSSGNGPSNGGQNPSTGAGSGSGQSNPGNGSSAGQGNGSQPTATGQPASSHSSGGGSSPLVPILIAIAVLAAISIAVVMYRQRRQDGDTGGDADGAVSPKAS